MCICIEWFSFTFDIRTKPRPSITYSHAAHEGDVFFCIRCWNFSSRSPRQASAIFSSSTVNRSLLIHRGECWCPEVFIPILLMQLWVLTARDHCAFHARF